MNKLRLRLGLCSAFAILAASTQPAWAGSPGLTTTAVINTAFARDIGMDINTSATSNPMGCSVANWFRIVPSTANYSVLISTALTAYSAHKNVVFWVASCDSDGVSLVTGVMSN